TNLTINKRNNGKLQVHSVMLVADQPRGLDIHPPRTVGIDRVAAAGNGRVSLPVLVAPDDPPVTTPAPLSGTEPLPARGETPVTLLPRKLKVYLPVSIAFDPAASPPFVQVTSAWATPTWPAATTAVVASAINMTLNLSIDSSMKFPQFRSRPPDSLTG